QTQIQKQIGGHPYVIKIASDRERRFSELKLKNIIDMLATTDATIKQWKMDKGLAFEILLYNLIQKSKNNTLMIVFLWFSNLELTPSPPEVLKHNLRGKSRHYGFLLKLFGATRALTLLL